MTRHLPHLLYDKARVVLRVEKRAEPRETSAGHNRERKALGKARNWQSWQRGRRWGIQILASWEFLVVTGRLATCTSATAK